MFFNIGEKINMSKLIEIKQREVDQVCGGKGVFATVGRAIDVSYEYIYNSPVMGFAGGFVSTTSILCLTTFATYVLRRKCSIADGTISDSRLLPVPVEDS